MAAATTEMQEKVEWTPGKELAHWVINQQLPIMAIVQDMEWKDAVRLAASSPRLWAHVEWLVALARPDRVAALYEATPDRLQIPLLTGLTAEQVRADNTYALRWACGNGQLETAEWLAKQFQLTAADARADDNGALRWSCQGGRLATAQWLTERFQLTAADARAGDNGALRWACGNGHLTTAQWLVQRFQLTTTDARAWNNHALRWAKQQKHWHVIEWLEEEFGLTRAEINE